MSGSRRSRLPLWELARSEPSNAACATLKFRITHTHHLGIHPGADFPKLNIDHMQVVPLHKRDFVRWRNAVRAGFGDRISAEDTIFMRDYRAEIDRLLACVDGSEIVGTGGADSFEMTLPGNARVPVAGIAYITTSPTHRRRGIQREIMSRIHSDARERGDVAAILWASMGNLYGRYGYGNAIPSHDWKIRREFASFAHFPEFNGSFQTLRRDEAIPMMSAVYDAARRERPGMIDRRDKRWQYEVHPKKNADDFFVICLEGNQPRGYAQYVFQGNPTTEDEFAMTVDVHEAIAVDAAAHAAIWRFMFDEPLTHEIVAHNRPVDDPVYWMLTDQRRLRRSTNDSIWLKLLDIPAMLSQRRYRTSGSFVLEVADDTDGTRSKWHLETSVDGPASCKATTRAADISLPEHSLAAAYFGAVTFSSLAAIGEAQASVRGHDLLRDLDAAFKCSPAAWNPFHF